MVGEGEGISAFVAEVGVLHPYVLDGRLEIVVLVDDGRWSMQ